MTAPAYLPRPRTAPTLRPAPRREPPFDDELSGPHLHLVGPLDQFLPFPDLEITAPARSRLQAPTDLFDPRPTGRGDLPEPATWARALVVMLLEILAGHRPVHQLTRMTSPSVLNGVRRDAVRLTRLGGQGAPGQVSSVHVCEPADGVAEVSAVITSQGRYRAVALRLEGLDGSWRCVRLAIG